MINLLLYKRTTYSEKVPFFYSFLFTIFLTIIAAIILILSYKRAIKLIPNGNGPTFIFNFISNFNSMKIPLRLFSHNERIRLNDEDVINYAFNDSDNDENSTLIYKKTKTQP
ncbi:uncharacterized protein T551_03422 [Pneumocystis jirovecii RU7]|uniref:Uncharacterized protein n=1 Tax=Pneumocystis jirovecii (strain RU7) TaxID=1408657 RepID=A0A0W4ZDP6_PNEJ7|nr:uncharacterized protein T551_03422 [Pneumocystis jirovecii RU7]KTW26505.1 hypothetical protein T551_03422 [Pneumocystis jirovecii RU7]